MEDETYKDLLDAQKRTEKAMHEAEKEADGFLVELNFLPVAMVILAVVFLVLKPVA